jgi:hypothetical protein
MISISLSTSLPISLAISLAKKLFSFTLMVTTITSMSLITLTVHTLQSKNATANAATTLNSKSKKKKKITSKKFKKKSVIKKSTFSNGPGPALDEKTGRPSQEWKKLGKQLAVDFSSHRYAQLDRTRRPIVCRPRRARGVPQNRPYPRGFKRDAGVNT